jgi:adenine-specific DNA-methyltransferase
VEFQPEIEKTVEQNIELLKKYILDKEDQLITDINYEDVIMELLLKNGFTPNFKIGEQKNYPNNKIYKVMDGEKESLICLDNLIELSTVEKLINSKENNSLQKFICLERALDTTKKISLKNMLGSRFKCY